MKTTESGIRRMKILKTQVSGNNREIRTGEKSSYC
jgi:hypothetical protein